MSSQHFLFSDHKSDRIRRHLLFWILWAVYFISSHIASPFLGPADSHFNNFPYTATEGFLIFVCLVPICYITSYLILPIYTTQKKLFKATVWLVLCWIAYYYLYSRVQDHVFPLVLEGIVPRQYLPKTPRPPAVRHFMGLLSVFLGGVATTAFVAGFRYIKQWHLKEQKNIQLQKENAASQLQLLTAQVHPHFLFNTLNNIYSQTQTESPKGSKMIMELSDMLRYILSEGSQPLVPLQKELAMLQDYINLEKIRYGNKLDLHLSIPPDTDRLQIAPLMLLPFIENCFKHGASKFLAAPWINLNISIHGSELIMKLINGKAAEQQDTQRPGTGISNVQKRLELLYPGKYALQVNEEPDVFVVNLKLELAIEKSISTIAKTFSNHSYA